MNNLFKSFVLLFWGSILSTQIQSQNISINLAGATGHSSAILDLSDASNAHLGFMIPNVSLASATDATTINPPVTGMIVWNTNSGMPFGVGYYYWLGGQWNYLQNSGTIGTNCILNQTLQQASANFNISGTGTLGGLLTANAGLTSSGAAVNLNASSNFATNIGTGSTTGNVSIGGSSNNVLLPKYTTNNEVLYTSGGTGIITATTGTPATNNVLLYNGTTPAWGADPAIATSWEITGNGNITDGTNFIGTTNTSPINFKINGTTAGRIDYNGGNGNTFLGYAAGASSPTGVQTNTEYNVAVGDDALNALTSGTRNIAIGSHALYDAASVSYNTAIGRYSQGAAGMAGSYNTSVGPNTLYNNTNGSYNTIMGTGSSSGAAAVNNLTGNSNAVYGYGAFEANTAGSGNVAIGDSALNNSTGSYNTALGWQAGLSVGAFVNTTSIGNGATATASNTMVFGNHSVTAVQFNGALMPYYSSAYNAGTTGQVLTSQGSGAAPQWTTISSGGLTGATGGLSTSGANAILGGGLGTPSTLTRNSEIGMGGYTLTFSVASPNTNTPAIGIDLATNTVPAQALEIGGTGNTVRIDGLQSGNTYNSVPANNNTYLMYSNTNGDIFSIPAGTTNYILTQTSSGPQWVAPGGGSISGTAGGVFYGTGSSYGVTAAGTNPQVLVSNGSGAPVWGTPSTQNIVCSNGTTLVSGTTVELGNAASATTGQLTQNTEVPLNANYLSFSAAGTSSTPGQVGINLSSGTAPQNALDDNGSLGTGIVTVSGTTTLNATANTVLASPGTYTITLPSVSGSTRRLYNVVYNGAANGIITIKGNGSDNISYNGTAANTFAIAGGTITLQSNGTTWYFVSGVPVLAHGTTTYSYSGTIQSWIIPTGISSITVSATGASGGNGAVPADDIGGYGGAVSNQVVPVTAGHTLNILVGQAGMPNPVSGESGGGGGASYVWDISNTSLNVIAGGGGGAGTYTSTTTGIGGNATNTPTASPSGGGAGTATGTHGAGGGGGAGFTVNGTQGAHPSNPSSGGLGGFNPVNNTFPFVALGGTGSTSGSNGVNGGFGGGGASGASDNPSGDASGGAGGGGGWNGGAGANANSTLYDGLGAAGGSSGYGNGSTESAVTNFSVSSTAGNGSVTIAW